MPYRTNLHQSAFQSKEVFDKRQPKAARSYDHKRHEDKLRQRPPRECLDAPPSKTLEENCESIRRTTKLTVTQTTSKWKCASLRRNSSSDLNHALRKKKGLTTLFNAVK